MKDFIINMAEASGRIALEHLGKAKVSFKTEKNIVTEGDIAVEKFILETIRQKFPRHNIVSEESGDNKLKSDFLWYIDPIDGTNNYTHTDPNFCISIALAEKGAVKYGCVYLPMLKEMYYAEMGKGAELNGKKTNVSKTANLDRALMHMGMRASIKDIKKSVDLMRHFALNADRTREYGFAAGEMAFVAAGRAEGSVKLDQNSWDIAAGMLLIEEAGGKVTDFRGNPLKLSANEKYYLVCSNGLLHADILNHIKKVVEEAD